MSTNRPTTTATSTTSAPTATAEAELHVERNGEVKGIFRRLFRRTRAMIAAFRDSVVLTTRNAWRKTRNFFSRLAQTSAGKAVLSGFGMVYTAQLAIGSARFLAYSVGSGLAYLLTQVAAVGFIVLGTAWFLQFGSMLINALSAHPNLTTSEAV